MEVRLAVASEQLQSSAPPPLSDTSGLFWMFLRWHMVTAVRKSQRCSGKYPEDSPRLWFSPCSATIYCLNDLRSEGSVGSPPTRRVFPNLNPHTGPSTISCSNRNWGCLQAHRQPSLKEIGCDTSAATRKDVFPWLNKQYYY